MRPLSSRLTHLFGVAQPHLVGREVGVRVPAVIERHVVLLREVRPLLRLGRRIRVVPEADAEAPVDDAAARALRAGVAALEQRLRMRGTPSGASRTRSRRGTRSPASCGTGRRVSFSPGYCRNSLSAAPCAPPPFTSAMKPSLKVTSQRGKKPPCPCVPASTPLMQRDRLARQPLLLEARVVHERVAEPAGRLVREHVEVAALVGALRPALRHVGRQVGPEFVPSGSVISMRSA